MLVISLSSCRTTCRILAGLWDLWPTLLAPPLPPPPLPYMSLLLPDIQPYIMKVLFVAVVLVALLGLASAAPHKREDDRGVFDYDYKELWKTTALEEDMFDKEGVAIDRMIGKKADKPASRKEHHHHHHSHHHHKEHLKTNRVRNFFDDFRL